MFTRAQTIHPCSRRACERVRVQVRARTYVCTRKHEKTRENNRGLVIFFLVLRSLTNTTACRAKLSKRRTNKCKRHSRQARGQNEQTLAVGSGWGGVNEGHRTQQRKRRATATPRAPCNTLAQRLEQRAVAANPTADYSASGEGVHLTTGAVFQTESAPPPALSAVRKHLIEMSLFCQSS